MTTRFLATINVPGYLPMDDEPPVFDTAQEAWEYLANQRVEGEEDFAEEDLFGESRYSDTCETLCVLSTAQHWNHPDAHGVQMWLASNGIGPDGTGVIYGATPGGSLHDLGLAYAVTAVTE